MKRILALLTALCMLGCLVACGTGGEQPAEPTTVTTEATTTHPDDSTTVSDSTTLPEDSTSAATVSTAEEDSTTAPTVIGTTAKPTPTKSTATKPAATKPIASKPTIRPTDAPTTTRTTAKPLVDVEKKKLNVLIIGNSHSIDAFWLLYQAYMDQHPNTDLCVGILHYNGAAIDEHINFLETGEAVIRYYRNSTGWWHIQYDVTAEAVLTDRPWDVIMMQPAKEDIADETLNQDGRHRLAALVDRYVTTPHEFVWHVSWPSPNDEIFFSPDYIRQPPVGYKDKLTRLYGFNPITQFRLQTEMTQKFVLDDTLYSNAICSGSAVMHALLTQGMEQLDLWRDYTHLSDYGRLMVGYAITAQLTGVPIGEIGIDEIPIRWRHKQNKSQGPQTVTPEMKQGIVEAANHSLKDPWNVPPQYYPLPTTTTTTTTTTTVVSTETTEITTTTKTTATESTTATTKHTKPLVSATVPDTTTETTETAEVTDTTDTLPPETTDTTTETAEVTDTTVSTGESTDPAATETAAP